MSLVNTEKMLKKACNGGYAVGAFNVNNMEIIQAVVQAANELSSPLILQASIGARKYAGTTYLKKLVEAAESTTNIPIALHLDHGESFETCKDCIDSGFTSVMIDGSSLDYEKNVEMTYQVVNYAHKYNVSVEAELGSLAGIEDNLKISSENSFYTDPNQAADFVKKTQIDSLAIAIGTSHGACKFKPHQKPLLRFDILEKIQQKLPSFPLVLHGASSIPSEYVNQINNYGGNIQNALGIPEEELKKAAKMSISKINVDSDLRLAMTASIRKYLANYPDKFDPRNYLSEAKATIKLLVKNKIQNILGCANKAK